jgi:hypothetical protein
VVDVSLLKKYSQLALSTFSPSQASSVIPAECAECRKLIEYLKPYILSVLEEPSNVESVAKRLLEDERALSLLALVSQITLMKISESDLVATYRELGERFKSVGVDVEDALEAILEHDLWKLRQVRSNFGRFALMYLDFILNYPDDAYKYVVTLLSIMLLLLATYETIEPTKLRSIGEALNTLSEELESYTLTFMLMLEKPGVEEEVSATARTQEELKRVRVQ